MCGGTLEFIVAKPLSQNLLSTTVYKEMLSGDSLYALLVAGPIGTLSDFQVRSKEN